MGRFASIFAFKTVSSISANQHGYDFFVHTMLGTSIMRDGQSGNCYSRRIRLNSSHEISISLLARSDSNPIAPSGPISGSQQHFGSRARAFVCVLMKHEQCRGQASNRATDTGGHLQAPSRCGPAVGESKTPANVNRERRDRLITT